MVLIHEKITALLEQNRLKKRDLARALGVSPQTATDICKGRSAITLPHLRNLVALFAIRADFWLDDSRLLPGESDRATPLNETAGLPAPVESRDRLIQRLRTFAQIHHSAFMHTYPDLPPADLRWLGLPSEDAAVAPSTAAVLPSERETHA